MKTTVIILILHCIVTIVLSQEAHTKDIEVREPEDNEDLERKNRRRKKGQNGGQCGGYGGNRGGHGKTFGEKLFGDYTYISAPVMNYFFGCGVAALPLAPQFSPVGPISPIQPYPLNIGISQSQSGQGYGGHGGNGPGFGSHGGNGPGFGNYGGGFNRPGRPGNFGGFNPGFNQQPFYSPQFAQQDPSYQQYGQGANRPFQSVVSAAASGLGTALTDYLTSRPRKTYKQINKQVNQLLKPIYKLF